MEYFDQFTKSWDHFTKSVPNRIRHCMVTLLNENIVYIGGFKNGYAVDMFDVELEKWISLPDVKYYSDR